MKTPEVPVAKSKRQLEIEKEILFRKSGPFVHIHTPSLTNDIIFRNKEERYAAMAYIPMAAKEANVEIMAYALMSNHFHFIVRGDWPQGFFDAFLRRFSQYMSRHGRPRLLKGFTADYTEITSLKQFRDEIAYVIRNPFVVREDIHLFAYPWTSGFLYFNPFIHVLPAIPIDGMSIQQKREITKSRDVSLPAGLSMMGPFVNPASFVNYKLVEDLFLSARQFMNWTLKNVEAQVETAARLGESLNLADEELLPILLTLCRDNYGHSAVSKLEEGQKQHLAKQLKYDYHSSNGQIARLLNIPSAKIDTLFPLSASTKPPL